MAFKWSSRLEFSPMRGIIPALQSSRALTARFALALGFCFTVSWGGACACAAAEKGQNIYQDAGKVTRQKDIVYTLNPPEAGETYAVKCNWLSGRHVGMFWRAFLKILPEGEEKGAMRKLLEAHSELKARLRPSSATLRLRGPDGKLIKEIELGMTTLGTHLVFKVEKLPAAGSLEKELGSGETQEQPLHEEKGTAKVDAPEQKRPAVTKSERSTKPGTKISPAGAYTAELHVHEGFHGFYFFTFEYAS